MGVARADQARGAHSRLTDAGAPASGAGTTRGACTGCSASPAARSGVSCATTATTSRSSRPATAGPILRSSRRPSSRRAPACRARSTTRCSPPGGGTSPTRRSAAEARARSTSPTCAAAGATLASRATRSAAGADRGVYDPAISGDGSKVAFTTAATNLGAGDLGGCTQVFVRDIAAGTTTLVSRAGGVRGAIADDYSADPAISRDGRYVAFASTARNLGGRPGANASRIYVRDLRTGSTRAVSSARGFALEPSISADGSVVAYASIAAGGSHVLV